MSIINKHAYLIMAHTNFHQLGTLLKLLDDERNDIFLFIDQKVPLTIEIIEFLNKCCTQSILNFTKRHTVHWGGYSTIKAEIELFKCASKGNYKYYHLLSGMDLPLHNQDYIHAFFEKNEGKEFFTFTGKRICDKKHPEDRIKYYYFFQNISYNLFIDRWLKKISSILFIPIQKIIHINRISSYYKRLGYGSSWVSVTNEFVHYLLLQEDEIIKHYKFTWCADEIYKHTYLINSQFKSNIFIDDGVNDKKRDRQGNCRYINWWTGSPHIWTIDDKDELLSAKNRGYLFSRKFNEKIDSKIIEFIVKMVNDENFCQNAEIIEIF